MSCTSRKNTSNATKPAAAKGNVSITVLTNMLSAEDGGNWTDAELVRRGFTLGDILTVRTALLPVEAPAPVASKAKAPKAPTSKPNMDAVERLISRIKINPNLTDGELMKHNTMAEVAAARAESGVPSPTVGKAPLNPAKPAQPETFELTEDNVPTEPEQEKTMPKVTKEEKPAKPTKPVAATASTPTKPQKPSKPAKPAKEEKAPKPVKGDKAPAATEAKANPAKAPKTPKPTIESPSAAEREKAKALAVSLVHYRIMKALQGAGKDGLTYRGIEAVTGMYSILTAQLRKASNGGVAYPDSLGSKGLVDEVVLEGEKIRFALSKEGRKLISKS